MQKYRNKKVTIDGITFDSQKEGTRYTEIKLMKFAGVISDFIIQPKFLLFDKFIARSGEKIRSISYIADFAIKYNNKPVWVIEDIKGGKATQTADFKLKRKIFLKRYPCVEYLII